MNQVLLPRPTLAVDRPGSRGAEAAAPGHTDLWWPLRHASTLLLPESSRQGPRPPSPWRMAELEELLHALENRERERALRSAAQQPVGTAASAAV